jgi:hypothetical protein
MIFLNCAQTIRVLLPLVDGPLVVAQKSEAPSKSTEYVITDSSLRCLRCSQGNRIREGALRWEQWKAVRDAMSNSLVIACDCLLVKS